MQKKKQIKKIKKKHVVEFENNSFLTELYGNHDQNLAKFENYFNISISYRGNKLEISGDQESSLMAADKIMELYNELDNGIKLGIKDVDVFLKSKKIYEIEFFWYLTDDYLEEYNLRKNQSELNMIDVMLSGSAYAVEAMMGIQDAAATLLVGEIKGTGRLNSFGNVSIELLKKRSQFDK